MIGEPLPLATMDVMTSQTRLRYVGLDLGSSNTECRSSTWIFCRRSFLFFQKLVEDPLGARFYWVNVMDQLGCSSVRLYSFVSSAYWGKVASGCVGVWQVWIYYIGILLTLDSTKRSGPKNRIPGANDVYTDHCKGWGWCSHTLTKVNSHTDKLGFQIQEFSMPDID